MMHVFTAYYTEEQDITTISGAGCGENGCGF